MLKFVFRFNYSKSASEKGLFPYSQLIALPKQLHVFWHWLHPVQSKVLPKDSFRVVMMIILISENKIHLSFSHFQYSLKKNWDWWHHFFLVTRKKVSEFVFFFPTKYAIKSILTFINRYKGFSTFCVFTIRLVIAFWIFCWCQSFLFKILKYFSQALIFYLCLLVL